MTLFIFALLFVFVLLPAATLGAFVGGWVAAARGRAERPNGDAQHGP